MHYIIYHKVDVSGPRHGSTPVSTVLWKSVRFFIIDIVSCKASSEEKELAKLSCLNDSETQERGLWEV